MLVAASWPPWDLHYLVWVALVPWLVAISNDKRILGAFLQGLWLSFVIGLFSAHWVAHAAREFLELSLPASIVVLLVFAATCAQPHLLLAGPAIAWGEKQLRGKPPIHRTFLLCLCLALLYTGLDAIVPRLFDVGLGYALHGAPRLRQLADVGGVSLLTFTIILVNLVAWRAWVALCSRPVPRSTILSYLLLVGLVWGGAALYGEARNRANAAAIERSGSSLRVGVVQGNVANDVRLAWARGDDRAAETQLAAYMLPTEELARETPALDLIVWPEATFPGVFQQPRSTLQRGRANKLDRQLMRLNRPVVFGAYDLATKGQESILYNSLFAITPRYDKPGTRGTVQAYRKHELLAFAETIPGISQSDWFRRHLPSMGFFGAGRGPGRFEITIPSQQRVSIGPIICSESLSASHVIDTARRSAQVLLNVGSDGWFGQLGEPQFHLAVARLRSVETRRPQVRAANTGISALILPGGEIAARSVLGTATTLSVAVPLVSIEPSLIMRWGDWFGWASLAAGAVLLLVIQVVRDGSFR